MINYPERLNLAQTPTPFYPLERLSEELGGPRIWIKRDDLTGAATSGNKIRKLEFLLAEALANGCDTLITSGGVQSNHCRSVALLGAQLGLKVHLLLRADIEPKPVGNLLLDHLAGARISHYSVDEYRGLNKLFAQWQEHYADLGRKAYSIPTGGSNGTGMWGYIAAAEELSEDFKRNNIVPQAIVHATGSAGTQAGLMLGCHLHQINTQVKAYAVCDNAEYFSRKVRSDLEQLQSQYSPQTDISGLIADTSDQYIGPAYGVAGDEVFDCIKQVAALEGILLDPVYTGKAFFGMMEDIKKGQFSHRQGDDIVFVHTGGLFGLFAQQDRLRY
jgi:D-cysteine desulfhydrase